MKEFFDTSVLIGAFWRGHPHHDASLKLVSAANRKNSACAAHTLAEVYATMTALPVKDVIPPDQALLFVQEARDRCTIVTLTEDDYSETIERAAARGLTSGRIYDALLLHCAAKVKAEAIYTWNLKHFQTIAPQLADRIQTP
jgi:predicted nucleic acid-binding protein